MWRLQREWVLSVRDVSVKETTYCRWRDCFLHHASTMADPLVWSEASSKVTSSFIVATA